MARSNPNDLPNMLKDEARTITFKFGPIIGAASISSVTVTSTPTSLTIGTPTTDDSDVTALVTASQTGCFILTAFATLSDGQKPKLQSRLKVEDPTASSGDLYPSG